MLEKLRELSFSGKAQFSSGFPWNSVMAKMKGSASRQYPERETDFIELPGCRRSGNHPLAMDTTHLIPQIP